ncbi:MAG: DUF6444 domain-containing protein [Desulfobacterales bacterium]|nr:DUF6444 domain-containing protein [Desulfobacterales bacterium]
MVFFTSIIIVAILYYLQADGLIYITIIALCAELINIFLTHTLTKSVEDKMKARHRRSIQGYLNRIKANKKTIKELEQIKDDAAGKIYKANEKIKELELQIEKLSGNAPVPPPSDEQPKPEKKKKKPKKEKPPEQPADLRDHLPDGSNRKKPPV